MPDKIPHAFADHRYVGDLMTADASDAEQILALFVKVGTEHYDLTDQLQREGEVVRQTLAEPVVDLSGVAVFGPLNDVPVSAFRGQELVRWVILAQVGGNISGVGVGVTLGSFRDCLGGWCRTAVSG